MSARPCIIIDTREQRPLRFSAAVDTQIATLHAGDYSVAGFTDRVAIERKSLADLVACVGPERERFLDCCARLRNYDLRAVVVEASLEDVMSHSYRSMTRPQSIVGTTIAMHVDYGLPTIWAGDAHNAAAIVEKLLTRVWKKNAEAT